MAYPYPTPVPTPTPPASYSQPFIGPVAPGSPGGAGFIGPVLPSQPDVRYPSTSGSVLGTSTGGSTGGAPQPGGVTPDGSWSVGYNGPGGGTSDYENQMRSQIEGGYNDYFNQLDEMMNTLPGQAENQSGIVNSQLQAGQTNLEGQQAIGLNDLARETQRVETGGAKSLKDIGSNIGSLLRAGNVYLGTRGAGDSSAADQMAFAYGKLGSQARGQVMNTMAEGKNQIADREFKLKTTYNTAVNQLKSEAEQKTLQIAQWLSEQQQSIRQMKASGSLQKGQDLASMTSNFLNIALQQAQEVRTQAANKQAMLEQWAMSNATNIQQLKANLGMVTSGYQAPVASYTNQGFNVGNNVGAAVGKAGVQYGGTPQKEWDPLTGTYK